MQTKNKDQQIFEHYIKSKKILVADASSSARSSIFKVFQDLGAKSNQITLTNTYKQALQLIGEIQPHIVIAEYDLGKSSGLELFQSQRAQPSPENKTRLFIIVTGNTSQSAVARAAEEDIDAYVLKPFTPEVVRSTIMKAAISKIKPSDYQLAIDKGKELLNEGTSKLDEAEKVFQDATTMDPNPALAFYYIGQIKFLRKILEQAQGSYSKGLEFNKIHYKCLVGMYELLMSQNLHAEAYEVVKRVSQYFPANPKRLAEVLRLAIINGKYEDVEKYYAIFTTIDDRDEVLIKYICAALVVCGKYYLSTKAKMRAIELFQKAAATGTGRIGILKQVVQALMDYKLTKDAQIFLGKFPAETHTAPEYLILKFQLLNVDGQKSMIIDSGRELISKDIHDPYVYAIMIQRSVESKLGSAAEDMVRQGTAKFPKYKELFEAIHKDPTIDWKITN